MKIKIHHRIRNGQDFLKSLGSDIPTVVHSEPIFMSNSFTEKVDLKEELVTKVEDENQEEIIKMSPMNVKRQDSHTPLKNFVKIPSFLTDRKAKSRGKAQITNLYDVYGQGVGLKKFKRFRKEV